MRLFQNNPAMPGRRLLLAGLASFAVTLAVSLALLAIRPLQAPSSLEVLLLTPVFLCVPVIVAAPGLFVYGMLAGVPGVSMMYAVAMVKRNWQGIAGVILLIAACASVAFAVAGFL